MKKLIDSAIVKSYAEHSDVPQRKLKQECKFLQEKIGGAVWWWWMVEWVRNLFWVIFMGWPQAGLFGATALGLTYYSHPNLAWLTLGTYAVGLVMVGYLRYITEIHPNVREGRDQKLYLTLDKCSGYMGISLEQLISNPSANTLRVEAEKILVGIAREKLQAETEGCSHSGDHIRNQFNLHHETFFRLGLVDGDWSKYFNEAAATLAAT